MLPYSGFSLSIGEKMHLPQRRKDAEESECFSAFKVKRNSIPLKEQKNNRTIEQLNIELKTMEPNQYQEPRT